MVIVVILNVSIPARHIGKNGFPDRVRITRGNTKVKSKAIMILRQSILRV